MWWLGLIPAHLPVRLAILPSDTPAHDSYHLAISAQPVRLWPHTFYFQQELINVDDLHRFARRVLWDLRSILDHLFKGMEAHG